MMHIHWLAKRYIDITACWD